MNGAAYLEFHQRKLHGKGLRQRRRKRSFSVHKLVFLLVFTLILTFLCGISFGSILSSATTTDEKAGERFKYYTSISIETGDSLWSIAEEYRTEEYASVEEYIEELCFINSLSGTQIHAGRTLTVPYYSSEFR